MSDPKELIESDKPAEDLADDLVEQGEEGQGRIRHKQDKETAEKEFNDFLDILDRNGIDPKVHKGPLAYSAAFEYEGKKYKVKVGKKEREGRGPSERWSIQVISSRGRGKGNWVTPGEWLGPNSMEDVVNELGLDT